MKLYVGSDPFKLGTGPCHSCGMRTAGVTYCGLGHPERVCVKCGNGLIKAIKKARLRRDTYDLAVNEWRTARPFSDSISKVMMRDAGFPGVTLTEIGLGYQ